MSCISIEVVGLPSFVQSQLIVPLRSRLNR
jgi:hypothetical protein